MFVSMCLHVRVCVSMCVRMSVSVFFCVSAIFTLFGVFVSMYECICVLVCKNICMCLCITGCVRFVFVSVCVCAYHIFTGNSSSETLYLQEAALSAYPILLLLFCPLPPPPHPEGLVIKIRGRKMLL